MAEVQSGLDLIEEKGATVIAISPEKPDLLEMTACKTGASFILLYDEDFKISDAFDVTFKPNTKQRMIYNTVLGADLKEAHSDDSERLPIPATFIIDEEGVVIWRQFDPDYKNRSTIEEIIDQL